MNEKCPFCGELSLTVVNEVFWRNKLILLECEKCNFKQIINDNSSLEKEINELSKRLEELESL